MKLMPLRLTWWLLMSISDYSCSIPSGTTAGKVWRRRTPYACEDTGPRAKFTLGMYGEPECNTVPIYWFPVVIVEGPEQANLERTDWSHYARWKSDRAQEQRV